MTTTIEFDRYLVWINGSREGITGRKAAALLECHMGPHTGGSESLAGRIFFYEDDPGGKRDTLWHSNPLNPNIEWIDLHMPMSRFDSVMSTVRLEKPLHLYINVDRGTGMSTRGYGGLGTIEREPIGEEEEMP